MNAIFEYILRVKNSPDEMLIVLFELLLIGIVVYWAVSFLEGTRGERLFRGVIFIIAIGTLILNLGVNQFELETSDILVTALFRAAFEYNRYGFASMFALVIFIILRLLLRGV